MWRFRDISLKSKLTILAITSSGIAGTLCCLGFVYNDVRMIKSAKVEECQSLANMLAFNSTAVLSFHDASAASTLLKSLESQPAIDHACLLDADGMSLTTYSKDPSASFSPTTDQSDGVTFTKSGKLEIYHSIVDDGNVVGKLVLCANMDGLRSQLIEYGKITFVVFVVSVNVVMFISSCLRRVIANPILNLAKTAKRISENGDYGVRASWDSEDELGDLHMAFNLMLDEIERSGAALQTAHDELEQRVLDRTCQLSDEIAERERAQVALEHARDNAEEANRAKSNFLANMSHEIRTPLNAILGFTDLMMMGGDDGDAAKRQEYLALIHTSGEHLLGLINDILDLSKIESGNLAVERLPCSPQQMVAEVVSVLRVRANEKGIDLEYEWQDGVPQVIVGDPGRIRQLLVNLVGNAIKFTSQGCVRIVGRMSEINDRLQLVFDVIDTGVGIPADKLQTIFDPFVQADNSVTRKFGGTGLGLAICRRIAEAFEGKIEVRSEVGQGSTFTASLHVEKFKGATSANASKADILAESSALAQKTALEMPPGRVLVVEDGETNRKLISLILRRSGLEVVTAENGQLGVDAATSSKFDIILMDMQMPVMDGYTAATTLRDRGMTLPIIALTAHAMKGDEQKCRAAGCSGFMTKPIHADLLLRKVAEELHGRKPDVTDDAAKSSATSTTATGSPIFSTLPVGDPEFAEIVNEFVDRLHEQMAAIQRAADSSGYAELARLAHWLKGAGGSAGFDELTAPAKKLELLAKESAGEHIDNAIKQLAGVVRRIVKPSDAAVMGV